MYDTSSYYVFVTVIPNFEDIYLILFVLPRPNDDDLMCDKKILQAIKLADYCDQVMSGELKLLENDVS